MLESLHISNYALIDEVNIDFHPGLNIITGETGAGKSIMLGALSLILGGRADTRSVRATSRKSVIEAVFVPGHYPALQRFCEENDIDWDDTRCILRREINASTGRSRAFVNDSPVPLAKLSGAAMLLIDIHSQHQNQLLSRPEFQLKVIDSLADNADKLREHARRYAAFREAVRRLKAAQAAQARSRDDEEYMRYQLDRLASLNLTPGEQEELERERDLLSNLSDIKEALARAIAALDNDEGGALDGLREAADAVDSLGQLLDPEEKIQERLADMVIDLADITNSLRNADADLQADPVRLEAVEQRLNGIWEMQHRHKVDSVEALIAIRDDLENKLAALDNSDEHLRELTREARRLQNLAKESAAALTEARLASAEKFAGELTETAAPLGMKNLRVEILVTPADMTSSGADRVDFRFAFNKNQTPIPVGEGASGGEISRLMLSIKSIIASRMELPSIIFDEVDTGVSGDVANRMGVMMRRISKSLQVIAITHLPAVAAKGEHHYKVYKQDDETATHTRIKPLDPEERIAELATMLSGRPDDEAARANARALLENS